MLKGVISIMKKIARSILILIIVVLVSAIGGYLYYSNTISPMYKSTAKIIVTPGTENESSVRATDGGLVKDFDIVFKSDVVISAAQKTAGTTENIADYLTVHVVPNSNIIELICINPDQATAKLYVDAIAKNAIKTTSIIQVSSIQVLEYGDESNIVVKPNLYRNTIILTGIVFAICLFIEIVLMLVFSSFKQDDYEDDDLEEDKEYERKYGHHSSVVMPTLVHSQAPKVAASYSADIDYDEEDDVLEEIDDEEDYKVKRRPIRRKVETEDAIRRAEEETRRIFKEEKKAEEARRKAEEEKARKKRKK